MVMPLSVIRPKMNYVCIRVLGYIDLGKLVMSGREMVNARY